MDQVKTQLAAVKQHSFWAMCVGILLVTLGSWWHSTGVLNKQKEDQLSKIKSAQELLTPIRSNQKHPNLETSQAMDLLTGRVAAEVANGWQLQYEKQADVLVWPTSFSPEFREAVDKLRPIEIVPPGARFADELHSTLLLEYRDYIHEVLPSLGEKIGAPWTAKVSSSGGGMGMGGLGGSYEGSMPSMGGAGGYGSAMPGGYGSSMLGGLGTPGAGVLRDEIPIVIWDANNQQDLLQTHFGFTARESAPTTLEVLYAQEDFWVLDNIMDIIRTTNDPEGEGLSGPHEAAIKRVYFVRLGRTARGLAGRVTAAGGSAGGMGSGMPMEMASGMGGMSAGGASSGGDVQDNYASASASGSSGGGASAASTDPAEGRYVNPEYQPLEASRLRSALTSDSAEDALLAVAKRMPVRVRFQIDQRRLNRLLAECGNAKLPVEVRQVRINRLAAPAGGMGSGGMPGMGMPGMGGGYDGGMDTYDGGMDAGYDPGGMGGMELGGGYDSYDGGYDGGYGGFGGGLGGIPGAGQTTRRAAKKGSQTEDASVNPHLIDVELYGIVYIYNPVNKKQLGLDTEASSVAGSSGETPVGEEQPAGSETPAPIPTTPTSTPAPPVASGPAPPAIIAP